MSFVYGSIVKRASWADQLIVSCQAGPRTEASAQARHEAHAGLGPINLMPYRARAGPKGRAVGRSTGLGPDGQLYHQGLCRKDGPNFLLANVIFDCLLSFFLKDNSNNIISCGEPSSEES
jgi:hypothetical protein